QTAVTGSTLIRREVPRIERFSMSVPDVMNHNLIDSHFVENEVRIAHDRKHADAGIVGGPSNGRKHFELADRRADSLLDFIRSAWIAVANIVGDGNEIGDGALRIAHLHRRKRAYAASTSASVASSPRRT